MSGKNNYRTDKTQCPDEDYVDDNIRDNTVDPFLVIPNIGSSNSNEYANGNKGVHGIPMDEQQHLKQDHQYNTSNIDYRITQAWVSSAPVPLLSSIEETKIDRNSMNRGVREVESFEDEFSYTADEAYRQGRHSDTSNHNNKQNHHNSPNPFTEMRRSIFSSAANSVQPNAQKHGEMEARLGNDHARRADDALRTREDSNNQVDDNEALLATLPKEALDNERRKSCSSSPSTPPSMPEDLMDLSVNENDGIEKREMVAFHSFVNDHTNEKDHLVRKTTNTNNENSKFMLEFPPFLNITHGDGGGDNDGDGDGDEGYPICNGDGSTSLKALANPEDEALESPFLWMSSADPSTARIPAEIVLDDDERGKVDDELLTGDGDESNQNQPMHPLFRPPTLSASGKVPRPKALKNADRQLTPQSWQTPLSSLRPKTILRNMSGGSRRTESNNAPLTPRSGRTTPKSEKYYYSYETDPSAPPTPVPPFVVVHSTGSAVVKVTAKSTTTVSASKKSCGKNRSSKSNSPEHPSASKRKPGCCGGAQRSAKNWCWNWGRPVTIALASAAVVLAIVTVASSLVASHREQQQQQQQPILETVLEADTNREHNAFRGPTSAPTVVPQNADSPSPTDSRATGNATSTLSTTTDPPGTTTQSDLVLDALGEEERNATAKPIWEGVVKRPYEETSNPANPNPTMPPRTFSPSSSQMPTLAPSMLPEGFPELVPTNPPFLLPRTTPEPSPGGSDEDQVSEPPTHGIAEVPWNNYLIGLLSVESPSTFSQLADEKSPQFLALQWGSIDAFRRGGASAYTMDGSLQRYALATLYFALGGGSGGWSSSDSWLSSSVNECDWFGVTCDSYGSGAVVLSLDLSANGLSGTLPPELNLLGDLQILRLQGNAIGGTLPPGYSDLGHLVTLNLSGNDIGGSIPWEYGGFGSFDSLETLDLGHNHLEGSLPPELGGMSSLRALTVCSNRLEGTVPPELAAPERLVALRLGGNSLTGAVPESICDKVEESTGPLLLVSVDCSVDCWCCESCCGSGDSDACC